MMGWIWIPFLMLIGNMVYVVITASDKPYRRYRRIGGIEFHIQKDLGHWLITADLSPLLVMVRAIDEPGWWWSIRKFKNRPNSFEMRHHGEEVHMVYARTNKKAIEGFFDYIVRLQLTEGSTDPLLKKYLEE